MEVRKKRRFEVGFKRQVVVQIESGQVTVSQAARNHDISPTVINYWRKRYRDGGLTDGPTGREKELEKELDRYKRLLAEAHGEIDRQKKYQDWIREQRRLSTSIVTGLNFPPSGKGVEK